jgi:hypothetical protein
VYHIANHRNTDSIRSFLEDDSDEIKKEYGDSKTCKNIVHSANLYKEKIEKIQ